MSLHIPALCENKTRKLYFRGDLISRFSSNPVENLTVSPFVGKMKEINLFVNFSQLQWAKLYWNGSPLSLQKEHKRRTTTLGRYPVLAPERDQKIYLCENPRVGYCSTWYFLPCSRALFSFFQYWRAPSELQTSHGRWNRVLHLQQNHWGSVWFLSRSNAPI